MKRAVYIILLILACAGGLILATSARSHSRRHAARRDNYRKLARRIGDLRIQVNTLAAANRRDIEELRLQSRRVTEAEARLREEQATNDPLRQQVARLVAQEIRARNEIVANQARDTKLRAESAARVGELTRQVSDQEQELSTSRSQAATAQQTVKTLTDQLARAKAELGAGKTLLATVRTQAAALEKQVKSTQDENRKLKAQLEALRKKATKPAG